MSATYIKIKKIEFDIKEEYSYFEMDEIDNKLQCVHDNTDGTTTIDISRLKEEEIKEKLEPELAKKLLQSIKKAKRSGTDQIDFMLS